MLISLRLFLASAMLFFMSHSLVLAQTNEEPYLFTRDLYYGLENDEAVRELQKRLAGEGCFNVEPTGNFFNITREAVICFQSKYAFHPIPNTGYVGPYTRKVLNDLSESQIPVSEDPDGAIEAVPSGGTDNAITEEESVPEIEPVIPPEGLPIPLPPQETEQPEDIDNDSPAINTALAFGIFSEFWWIFLIVLLLIVAIIAVQLALKKGLGISIRNLRLLRSLKKPKPKAPQVSLNESKAQADAEPEKKMAEAEAGAPPTPIILSKKELPEAPPPLPAPEKEADKIPIPVPPQTIPNKELYFPEPLKPSGKKIGNLGIWRTIQLGKHKNTEDLVADLREKGFKVNMYHDPFNPKYFNFSSKSETLNLVLLSISDLGFSGSPSFEEIRASAKSLGLVDLPAEVGPELRLVYKDQPEGESIIIGMQPFTDFHGDRIVFVLENDSGEKWLNCLNVPDNYYGSKRFFVFGIPDKS